MKILIKGAFGNYNFGDDLLAYAILKYLEKHDKDFTITLLSRSEYLLNFFPNINIIPFEDNNEIYDICLFAGGTQFASFNKKSLFEIYKNRFLFIFSIKPKLLFQLILNKFKSKSKNYEKLVILGVGIGPFYSKDKYYHSSISLLKKSNLLAVRDVLSEKTCEENYLNYIKGSDLVYSLPESFWKDFKYKDNNRKKKVAFIIRDWEFNREKASFINILSNLTIDGYETTFISFCKEKDINCLNILSSGRHKDSIKIWNPSNNTFQQFINDLNEYDIFVTARYHGAIISSLLKKPFISIGIEPKLTMVSDLFNMPCWDYPYNAEILKRKIGSLELNYLTSVAKIKKVSEKEKIKAENMMSYFDRFIVHDK